MLVATAGGGVMISAHIHHILRSSGGLRALTGAMSALQVGIHASSGRFTDLKTAVAPGAATRPSSGRVLCAMWPIEALLMSRVEKLRDPRDRVARDGMEGIQKNPGLSGHEPASGAGWLGGASRLFCQLNGCARLRIVTDLLQRKRRPDRDGRGWGRRVELRGCLFVASLCPTASDRARARLVCEGRLNDPDHPERFAYS